MTYQIYYTPKNSKDGKRYIMFDIEYYIKASEAKKDYWSSDICCLPRVEGITKFLKDKLNEYKFDCDEFVRCGKEIEEIRGLLHERYDNKPRIYNEACDFHYKGFGKVLEEKIEAFARKYDLHINRD